MNAATRSILGYQVSDNQGVGPCILAMRMAFQNLKKLSENFKFIADGYSAYPLAAMEFAKNIDIKFSNDPVQQKRGNCALSLPSGEDGFEQRPLLCHGTGSLWVLRAKP